MKIKKILALLLCVVMFSVMLVSCEQDETQYWLDWYKDNNIGQPVDVENVKIPLYIIQGDEMSADYNVKKTVNDKINQYLSDKYSTTVEIIYLDESKVVEGNTVDEYANAIASFSASSTGIVLINSADVMEQLSGKLVDLNPYLISSDYASAGYGTLNKQITTSLIKGAKVVENGVEKMYCIPNNHIVGNYEYIVINKAAAKAQLYAESDLLAMNTWEMTEELRSALGDSSTGDGVDYADFDPDNAAAVTRVINAPYAARAEIESYGNIVNISAYPTVDDDEVYSSAFAVLKGTPLKVDSETVLVDYAVYAERAMQVIYEINTNETVRNLLQYGVENVNYSIDENGIVKPNADKRYDMNLLYTGDIFKALYSEGWTKEDADYGVLQNKDSEK
ncbi:MAG: hypothetical protein IJX92_06130 [Clostridia bacterium]|nr:hypothetical protein [Clostridia bacterium]